MQTSILILAFLAGQSIEPPTYNVQGKIVDAGGKPVVGADLSTFWNPSMIERGLPQELAALKTKPDGTFRGDLKLFRLPVTLLAYDKARKRGGKLTLTKENIGKPHTLVLRPVAKLRFKVATEAAPLEQAGFSVFDDGTRSHLMNDYLKVPIAFPIPAGEYTLNLYAGEDAVSRRQKIRLAPGQSLDLGTQTLQLSPIGKGYGKPAIPLTVGEARGVPESFKLEDLKGKWVLLEFWGFW